MLRLRRRPAPIVPQGRREPFYRLVQAGFRQRRKQLHNALGRELGADRETLAAAFADCDVEPEQRAQTLTLEQWACLLARLGPMLEDAA